MHPHVSAVVVHENGDVAHNANRALRAIPPQCLPLFVESKLQGAADLQVDRQILPRLLKCCRFTMRQLCRPFIPARQFVLGAQRIEQDKLVQPPGILRAEPLKALSRAVGSRSNKIASRLKQQRHLFRKDMVVLNRARSH